MIPLCHLNYGFKFNRTLNYKTKQWVTNWLMIGKTLHVVNNFCQTRNSEIKQCPKGELWSYEFSIKILDWKKIVSWHKEFCINYRGKAQLNHNLKYINISTKWLNAWFIIGIRLLMITIKLQWNNLSNIKHIHCLTEYWD